MSDVKERRVQRAVIVCGICGRYQPVMTNQDFTVDIAVQLFDSVVKSCRYAQTLHHDGTHSDRSCSMFGCVAVEKFRELTAYESAHVAISKTGFLSKGGDELANMPTEVA